MCADLDVEFRDLITFLCYTSAIRRPITVFAPVEVYAGSLVKLHQYCVIGTDNVCFKKIVSVRKMHCTKLSLFSVEIDTFSDF